MKTIREIVIYILIAIAAFEGGIIYSSTKNLPNRITKIEVKQQELIGEVQSHKAILRGIGKGRLPQIPKGGDPE